LLGLSQLLSATAFRSKRCFFNFGVRVNGLFSQQIKSLQLRTLTDVSLTQMLDGSGVIRFGPAVPGYNGWRDWPGMEQFAGPCFYLIDNAKDVYDIVCDAQKGSCTTLVTHVVPGGF
jgi:hypothetical protein